MGNFVSLRNQVNKPTCFASSLGEEQKKKLRAWKDYFKGCARFEKQKKKKKKGAAWMLRKGLKKKIKEKKLNPKGRGRIHKSGGFA